MTEPRTTRPLLYELESPDQRLANLLQTMADTRPVGKIELALKRHVALLERAINQCRRQENYVAAAILWAAIEDTADTYRYCQKARQLLPDVKASPTAATEDTSCCNG